MVNLLIGSCRTDRIVGECVTTSISSPLIGQGEAYHTLYANDHCHAIRCFIITRFVVIALFRRHPKNPLIFHSLKFVGKHNFKWVERQDSRVGVFWEVQHLHVEGKYGNHSDE